MTTTPATVPPTAGPLIELEDMISASNLETVNTYRDVDLADGLTANVVEEWTSDEGPTEAVGLSLLGLSTKT